MMVKIIVDVWEKPINQFQIIWPFIITPFFLLTIVWGQND